MIAKTFTEYIFVKKRKGAVLKNGRNPLTCKIKRVSSF